jgi:hypothetical protein
VKFAAGAAPETIARPAAPSVGRILKNAVIFFAGLALACAVIRQILPFPEVAQVSAKRHHYAAHQDEYDLLFIGSSRVNQHFIPRQFGDRLAGLSGKTIRSFNFGVNGMWPPESFWMLRHLLSLKPGKLRWVFIEGMSINVSWSDRNNDSERMTYWHDWQHTCMAWESVLELPFKTRAKRRMLSNHAMHLVRGWTNQGRGADLITRTLKAGQKRKSAGKRLSAWIETDGYHADADSLLAGEARLNFEREVFALKANFESVPTPPAYFQALRNIVAELRTADIEPILVVTPGGDNRENYEHVPDGLPIFRFDDPRQYPALFEAENRRDRSHLNHAGAQIFTDLLAERFARHLEGKP